MKEQDIMSLIRIELSKLGYLVFRVNVGTGFTGNEVIKTEGGGVYLPQVRRFDTGLPKGFSDLFGLCPGGQAFFIEVKTPTGRIRPEQITFLNRMRELGANAGIARSVNDAIRIVRGEQL